MSIVSVRVFRDYRPLAEKLGYFHSANDDQSFGLKRDLFVCSYCLLFAERTRGADGVSNASVSLRELDILS